MQSSTSKIQTAGVGIGIAALLSGMSVAGPALAMDVLARVISSTPVVQQISVPRRVCEDAGVAYNREPVATSGTGAALGALAGGVVGNSIGRGNGRALATVLGVVGGALAGNALESNSSANIVDQPLTQCFTDNSYENRVSYYNVVYEYQDRRLAIRMPNDPGLYVRVKAGTIEPGFSTQGQQLGVVYSRAGQSAYSTQPVYAQPYQPVQIRQVSPPPVYYYPQQPVFIERPRTYVRPQPQVIVLPQVGYERGYNRGHYQPQYQYQQQPSWTAPPPRVGFSANIGYNRQQHRSWSGPSSRSGVSVDFAYQSDSGGYHR